MSQEEDSVQPGNREIAISVRNLSKEFKVHQTDKTGIKNQSYLHGLGMRLGKSKYTKLQVLKDISFDVIKGEMVGILGRNGAGKSTLLRIIAGIMEPTSGTVKVSGNMTSLLTLQSGLNNKLTARENIIQYGLILGLSKSEILERVDDVLEFAGLENFADAQVSHFSSGMNARLVFSASMLANPDILLLDEILAVGDYHFYQKCLDLFKEIRKKEGTVILVSHSLQNVKQYCDRAMLLHDGKIELIGEPEVIIKRYKDLGLDHNTKVIKSIDSSLDTGNAPNAIQQSKVNSRDFADGVVPDVEDLSPTITAIPNIYENDYLRYLGYKYFSEIQTKETQHFFLVRKSLPVDYIIFEHFVDVNGNLFSFEMKPIVPTTKWIPSRIYAHSGFHEQLTKGQYKFFVGLADIKNHRERLTIPGTEYDAIPLGMIEVK